MQILNPLLAADLETGRAVRLCIGAGHDRPPGNYSLDIRELQGVDVVADLEEPLVELPDESVEHVEAFHVLEHISRLDQLLDELHRVLVPGGTIDVRVPHWANPLGHSDPTHVRLFGLYSFCYLVPLEQQPLGRKVPTYRSEHHFGIADLRLCFRRTTQPFPRLESWLNSDWRRMEAYEKNLARFVWPYEIRCLLVRST